MKFDINKVIHPFSADDIKRKYIGKECIFADNLDELKRRVS